MLYYYLETIASLTYESTSSTKMSDSETTGSHLNIISKTTTSFLNITAEAKSSITLSGVMSSTMISTIDGMSFIIIYTSTI